MTDVPRYRIDPQPRPHDPHDPHALEREPEVARRSSFALDWRMRQVVELVAGAPVA